MLHSSEDNTPRIKLTTIEEDIRSIEQRAKAITEKNEKTKRQIENNYKNDFNKKIKQIQQAEQEKMKSHMDGYGHLLEKAKKREEAETERRWKSIMDLGM